jgi:hypothetical protein
MTEENRIIIMSEVIEQKLRKEKELDFYLAQLEDLQRKIGFLKKEVALTNTIIDMIKHEKIYDVEEGMLEKYDQYVLDFNGGEDESK